MNNNEWHITLASLATLVAFLFGGCGFLFTGAWWLLCLFVFVGVAYVAVLAHYLETGRDP